MIKDRGNGIVEGTPEELRKYQRDLQATAQLEALELEQRKEIRVAAEKARDENFIQDVKAEGL